SFTVTHTENAFRDALPKPDIPCRRTSYGKRVKQSFGLFQITGVEALSEPAVDRSQKICGLIRFALSAQKTRHASAARSSQDFACCARAITRACPKYASAFVALSGDLSAISPAIR